jgi:hypothetical protein
VITFRQASEQPSLPILQAADGLQHGQDQRLREGAPPDALEYDGGKRQETKHPELFRELRITAFEREPFRWVTSTVYLLLCTDI